MEKFRKIRENHIFQWFLTFGGTFLVMFVLLRILFGIAIVQGESMLPSYQDHQPVLFSRMTDYSYGDVVIVDSEELNEYIIKRVIGLPGDTIVITNGVVSRNGQELEEEYINRSEPDRRCSCCITVPEGTVFVMGDNRANSTDSRVLGCLRKVDVIGVVFGGKKSVKISE